MLRANYALMRRKISNYYLNLLTESEDPCFTRLYAYEDNNISMYGNLYDDPTELPSEVNERALDKYINKIIFNQAVSLADGSECPANSETCPLKYQTAKIPKKYIGNIRKTPEDQLPKQRGVKATKKTKSKKPYDKLVEEDEMQFKDLPEDADVTQKDGKTMVTMSIDMLRGYMYTEVESRVHYIHDFYEKQWNDINREKMELYSKVYEEKERIRTLESDLSQLHFLFESHLKINEDLNSKMNTSKEAKRRRRQAKKLRKQTTLNESMSDTGTSPLEDTSEIVELGTSRQVDRHTQTETSDSKQDERSGGGDIDSATSAQDKKIDAVDIDAEISALVI